MNANFLKYRSTRKLTTTVENRTVYSGDFAELNIFETGEVAEKVPLQFDFPIIASMLTGKKIMHLEDKPAFDFFPGESVVLPSNEKISIDFPVATGTSPTSCLALGIDPEKIRETVELFNNKTRVHYENDQYEIDDTTHHLENNEQVQLVLSRVFQTFLSDNIAKDALLDLMIQELILRLLQSRARSMLLDSTTLFEHNRMAYIVKYMKEHLGENITVTQLANIACMSTSNFYRIFKNTYGVSPVDFLNGQRITFAKTLIRNTEMSFTEIAFQAGFNNPSYFSRLFKRLEKITPNKFRKNFREKFLK
ncbi:AraC family transcriptional regulator [Salinimicrobium sp. CDJ15-81-2]|nr:AraC family transcriptional regulator [Salinimicrobium nanhaiense]